MPRATAICLTCFFALLSAAMPLHAQPPAEEDIRGPKELVVVEKTFFEMLQEEKSSILVWICVASIVILLVCGLVWWRLSVMRRRSDWYVKKALTALGELEANREAVSAETFAYQAALTVRSYIADRFGIAAPRRTTEEFLRDLAADSSPLASQGEPLRNFLKSCDLAKFAGSTLDENQRHSLIEAARGFIRSTSPAP